MKLIERCFFCDKEFCITEEDIQTYIDIRQIDEYTDGEVEVNFVVCPHCNQNTELWWY